ncbi:MAG: HDOD domain-containing protein [Chitinispirillia bacterium]|nr:HDOD domain-containing protein [Chitinispirillia bacterium]MCL2268466.1 HDOD domain-containing protein [Chitinispirillia bacterium]
MKTPLQNDIRMRLQSINSLQTQPAVIAKITQMLQNPATNADELGRAIRTDQVLASTVLKLVNSPFYGFPGRIGSVNHAVVLLGFSTVKNIVLTASVLEIFKMDAGDGKFGAQEFRKHSLGCAVAAQCLAQAIGYENKDECFVAGLVHDLGKMIMFQLVPDDFMRVIDCADKTKTLFYDSECKLLGINHQEAGGMLVEQWHLPPGILRAVSSHHIPTRDSGDTLTAIVHCADIFARAMGYGNGGDNKIPMISDNAWETLKLDGLDLVRLFNNMDKEWVKANSYFQLD